MGFNDYLGPLVNVEGVTSISTIALVDVDVGSFSSYIYQSTSWAKHNKTTVRGAHSLGNPSYSKLYFSPLSLAVAVARRPCRRCPSGEADREPHHRLKTSHAAGGHCLILAGNSQDHEKAMSWSSSTCPTLLSIKRLPRLTLVSL